VQLKLYAKVGEVLFDYRCEDIRAGLVQRAGLPTDRSSLVIEAVEVPDCWRGVEGFMVPSDTKLLEHLYERFDARDVEAVLAMMHRDVMWANGMEGGHVYGQDGVRDYWTRQWTMIDPHVELAEFSAGTDRVVIAEVHQIVRDLKGNVLSDKMVGHIFHLEHGLIRRFDIR
jgi:hypothetical protein